jgi:hypothetical protein
MAEPKLPKTIIPWWQDGSTTSETVKEPHFLSKGVLQFFGLIKGWLLFPLQQSDPLTCSEQLLTLKAWDSDIQRFSSEPLSLFRRRVKFAQINAKDAGSVVGFKAIFERLGVGIVAFRERENALEWDVCTIDLTDDAISKNSLLIKLLIEQYGRTCRRYRFQVTYPADTFIACAEFTHNFKMFIARTSASCEVNVSPKKIEHQQQVFIAWL